MSRMRLFKHIFPVILPYQSKFASSATALR